MPAPLVVSCSRPGHPRRIADEIAAVLDADIGEIREPGDRRLDERPAGGTPLLIPVMRGGRRLGRAPALQNLRRQHQAQVRQPPGRSPSLMPDNGPRHRVLVSEDLPAPAGGVADSHGRGRDAAAAWL